MRKFTKGKRWLGVLVLVAIVGAACGGGVAATAGGGSETPPPDVSTPVPGSDQPNLSNPTSTAVPSPSPTEAPSPSPSATETPSPSPTSEPPEEVTFVPGPEPDYDPAAAFSASNPFGRNPWRTDFSKHSIDYADILMGASRDGIPAIDRPKFVIANSDPNWLFELEPVIALEINGDARAYPLQIMTWHEIVNDVVGGVPVVVTFCPLCNTALTFERTVNGVINSFGVSGLLRFSDLIMYDKQTDSWWQQIQGEAIVGSLTGTKLKSVPASLISWDDFRTSFPEGQVLTRDTGFSRDYGRNPYSGYDNINSSPFLFLGPEDNRLRPVERVATVELNGESVAYPFLRLEDHPVVNDSVGGSPIVVFFSEGTVSALDSGLIAASRDIGATGVFSRSVDGQELTFATNGKAFVDNETGTKWNILGLATEGPLAGQSLEPLVHTNHFWFAWAAFKPETRLWKPTG